MSNIPKYNEFVRMLAKPGDEIAASLTPEQAHLLHMAVGISGEAGELLDAVKKHVVYNKELDLENVIEELGDLEFYMQGVRNGLGINRAQVIAHNMKKLGVRYEKGYSDKAAQKRADKQQGCLHPKMEWAGTLGYVCTDCQAPAAVVQEDVS